MAFDVSRADATASLVERLRGRVGRFKVGLELFTAEGPSLPYSRG